MTTESALSGKREEYKYGFVTDVETESIPKGLNEEVIRTISAKKGEPKFLLDFRLKAYKKWLEMKEPHWANVTYTPIDYQNISYYTVPKNKAKLNSLEEVDPAILATFERLGIPLDEQKRLSNVAVDMVFDSVSIGTTFKKKLDEAGVVLMLHFRSDAHARRNHRKILRHRRSYRRQFLCRVEFRSILRWILCIYP